MSLLKRVKEIGKDSLIYGASQVLAQLVGFLLLPVYTRFLTPSDYGVLAMLALITVVFPPLANLGLNNAVFRFYRQAATDEERERLVGTAHLLVICFSSTLLGIALLLSAPITVLLADSPEHWLACILALLSAWFISFGTIPLVVLKQQRRVVAIAVRSIAGLVVNVGVTLVFVAYYEWGVLGSVMGTLAGCLVAALLVLKVVNLSQWTAFAREKVCTLLKYSLPFVPYFLLAALMGSVGQYMVKEYISLEEAGFYGIAWRFSLPILIMLSAVNNSWAAFKFDIRFGDENPKASFRDIFSVYISFIAIIWLLSAIWLPHVLKIVVNDSFYPAAALIPIVSLIPLVQNLRGMLTVGMEMSESPRWVPILTLIGFVVTLCLGIYLSKYGAIGIAIAVVLGWVCTAIGTYVYSRQIYKINYNWTFFLTIFSISGFGYLLANWVLTAWVWQMVVSLLGVTIVVLTFAAFHWGTVRQVLEARRLIFW